MTGRRKYGEECDFSDQTDGDDDDVEYESQYTNNGRRKSSKFKKTIKIAKKISDDQDQLMLNLSVQEAASTDKVKRKQPLLQKRKTEEISSNYRINLEDDD